MFRSSLLLALGLSLLRPAHAEFALESATIADLQAAMKAGSLTAEKLTQLYLARIAAYDKQGPTINAVITLNDKALDVARALDAERKAKGPRGPLHGIPIVLKDIIDTADPQRFTMIQYRPVLEVRAAVNEQLLLFAGHRSILAWGADGPAWETGKLSDEGVTIAGIESGVLRGTGWEMMTDKEKMFAVDLKSGRFL